MADDKAAPDCVCGYYAGVVGGRLVLRPHAPDCVWLVEYASRTPSQRLEGEAALKAFDACGSGWIRDVIEGEA